MPTAAHASSPELVDEVALTQQLEVAVNHGLRIHDGVHRVASCHHEVVFRPYRMQHESSVWFVLERPVGDTRQGSAFLLGVPEVQQVSCFTAQL